MTLIIKTGTATAPNFSNQTDGNNPFNGVDIGTHASPSFADINNDGDLDDFIGELSSNINFFKNTTPRLIPVELIYLKGQIIGEGNLLTSLYWTIRLPLKP